MDCEQLALLYDEYALGILEGEEHTELEAHLARACPKCVPGVTNARWLVAQLAHTAPEVQAPPALRGKIMEAIRSLPMDSVETNPASPALTDKKHGVPPGVPTFDKVERRKPTAKPEVFPAWAWVAAAALALITAFTIRQMDTQNTQLAELRKEIKLATLQNQSLQNQVEQDRMVASVMLSPDSLPLKLMPTTDKNIPMLHAYLHPHMGVAITADAMPSVSASRTLQLWFVPKTGKPMSVAIFRPDAAGQIALVAAVNMPMNEIAALAVTEEPAGGSPQPTSAIAWMAKMN